jgi:hypothetical protein
VKAILKINVKILSGKAEDLVSLDDNHILRFNIFIAFKYFYTYTIRPRDCLYGELPPGRRISTGGIILF